MHILNFNEWKYRRAVELHEHSAFILLTIAAVLDGSAQSVVVRGSCRRLTDCTEESNRLDSQKNTADGLLRK